MVMHVTLTQETRGVSFGPNGTQLPVLWQGLAEDYNQDLSFGFSGDGPEEPADTAQVAVRMPFPLAQNIVPISSKPQQRTPAYQRARYVQIHDGPLLVKTWLIEGALIEQIGAQMAMVTMSLKGASAWVYKYPSRNGTDMKDLTGTRSEILTRLTLSVSNQVPSDGEPFKSLPILPFDPAWTPSEEQRARGYLKGSEVETGEIITVPSPDPLSITESLTTALAGWGSGLQQIGLTLIEEHGYDGSAPFWRWVLWKRVLAERMLTWDEMALYSIETSNEFTDAMSYNEDNPQEHRYLGGSTIANPDLDGAWLGVEFNGYTKSDPAGTLPSPSKPPNLSYGGGITAGGGWAPGGGTGGFSGGGGTGGGSWQNPSVGGNTVFPTPDGGFVGPDGSYVDAPDGPTVDLRGITLVVKAYSNTAITIPTRATMPAGETFEMNWSIYLDGVFLRDQTIPQETTGITVKVPFDQQDHIIEIRPKSGEYTTGWACRLGGNSRAQTIGPSLRMILAMGYGTYFTPAGTPMSHALQWASCSELTSVADPDISPAGATMPLLYNQERWYNCPKLEAGPADGVDFSQYPGHMSNNFRAGEFSNCIEMKAHPKLAELEKATSAGSGFLEGWLYKCTNVKLGPMLILPEVTSVGDNFLFNYACGVMDFTTDQTIRHVLPKAKTIGNYFLGSFGGGTSRAGGGAGLEIRGVRCASAYIPLLPSADSIGSHFMSETYMYVKAGVQPVVIDRMPAWPVRSIGPSFMANTFACNNAINENMIETELPNLTSDPVSWMFQTYASMAFNESTGAKGNGIGLRFLNPEVYPKPGALATAPANYRRGTYAAAMDIGMPKTDYRFMETKTRGATKPGETVNRVYRGTGFANNGYSGNAGERVSYTDGVQALVGQNGLKAPPNSNAFYGTIRPS